MRSVSSRGLSGRVFINCLMTAAAAALLAGCSNSIERFSQNYDNPSDSDPVYTASVPQTKRVTKGQVATAPAYRFNAPPAEETISESPVARAPLAKAQKTYDYTQKYRQAYKQPELGAAKPRIAYNKPKLTLQDEPLTDTADAAVDTAVEQAPVLRKPVAAAKGAKVKVGDGMTMYSIARANGVSVQELADANNMTPPYSVMVGQTLRIPGSDMAQAPAVRKPVADVALDDSTRETAAPAKSARGATHVVASGETLYSLGRKYGVSPIVIADANGMSHDQALSVGKKIKIPGAKVAKLTPAEEPVAEEVADADQPSAKTPGFKLKKRAPLALSEEEQQTADAATSDDTADETVATKKQDVAAVPASPGNLALRWPVKGKIISGFGTKPNGMKNEGINIAVPEGTGVRAAESGVVAYAGNELKGYGNLVLIRHAGGYVTAYAHAKEIFVKRGDKINRGDVIAKAGQTGAVSSPQLHFEVRKGATALDPSKFMSSATAAN